MSDPIDDLLRTPSGPFSPMDPMEFNAPEPVVEYLIRIAVAQFMKRRDAHRSEQPDDLVGATFHDQRVQSAVNALSWVQQQRTVMIKIGLYPIDSQSELDMYESLLELDPTLFDAKPGDLPGLDQDAADLRRHIERIARERPTEE